MERLVIWIDDLAHITSSDCYLDPHMPDSVSNHVMRRPGGIYVVISTEFYLTRQEGALDALCNIWCSDEVSTCESILSQCSLKLFCAVLSELLSIKASPDLIARGQHHDGPSAKI